MQFQIAKFLFAYNVYLDRPTLNAKIPSLPPNTQSCYRPPLWSVRQSTPFKRHSNRIQFQKKTALFHDCPIGDIIVRQIRNIGENISSPFGLKCDVFSFEGSYMSLSFPVEFADELKQDDNIMLRIELDCEKSRMTYATLNIGKGAQKEVQSLTCEDDGRFIFAEFDLSQYHTNLDGSQNMWFDLSFDNYPYNEIIIRDLCLFKIKKMYF